jgi:hypothetical protein
VPFNRKRKDWGIPKSFFHPMKDFVAIHFGFIRFFELMPAIPNEPFQMLIDLNFTRWE